MARRTGLRDDNPTGDAITAELSKRANHMRHMPALPHGEVAGAIEALIWSDLHLGHEHSRSVFGRPLRTAAAADEAMMGAWEDEAGGNENNICLGDVTVDGEALAHHREWWRKAPGSKVLVLGNHDVDPVNRIVEFEVDRTAVTLYAPGDPPLLLTHVPLVQARRGR